MVPARGGRERSVAEIAAELARRGHDVTILCQEGDFYASGVEVLPLGCGGLGRADKFAKFVAAVQEVMNREGYDIVHATLPVPGANVYQPRGGTVPGQIAGKDRLLCPLGRIVSRLTRSFNFARMCARRLEKQIFADPAVTCLAVSQTVAEEFATYYGRRENVRVVYGGVDVPQVDEATRSAWRAQWRRRWAVGEKNIVFLTVAHNFVLKGVAEAIESFADFESGDARLVIVGDEGEYPHRSLAERGGVGERVVFEKAVANIFELYSAADAVVLLSWQDACSRVVLEAIRWSVPSLTTRFNGAAELLGRGAGVVVESPRDRSGIVAAMEKLSDSKKRMEIIVACREAADYAANTRQVDELEKIYEDIAKRKNHDKRSSSCCQN